MRPALTKTDRVPDRLLTHCLWNINKGPTKTMTSAFHRPLKRAHLIWTTLFVVSFAAAFMKASL